jgi:drug/metabolite transporter (DMT)-like permease
VANSGSGNLSRAAIYMMTATFAFAGMSACIQVMSRTLPNTEVVFIRNLLGLVFLLPWLLYRQGSNSFKMRYPLQHLVRGVAGLASMYCYFYAVAHLPLATAVVLNYSVPLFFPFVEAVWLGERMPKRLWGPLVLGFVGVVIVLGPGSDVFHWASLVGLLAGFLSAIAQTGVRKLTAVEPPERIVFWFAMLSSLVSAVPMPVTWVTPSIDLWQAFALLGVCATVGQLSMTRAYSCAPASQVGAFVYTIVLFGALFDWLIKDTLPSINFVIGAVLICGSGAAMLRLSKVD